MTPTWLHNATQRASAIRSCLHRRELTIGRRVNAKSLSGAGGPGTISGSDEVLIYVRLDAGPVRSFLPHALELLSD